jgi:hypothetical protein
MDTMSRPPCSRETDLIPIVQGDRWAQDMSGRARKISPLSGLDPQTVQPVSSRYTDYAIRYEGKIMVNVTLCAPLF